MRGLLAAFLLSAATMATLLGWLLNRSRRQREPLRYVIQAVLRNVTWGLLLAIVGSGLLALDFDRSFVNMHRLLFEGDNWILPSHTLTIRSECG